MACSGILADDENGVRVREVLDRDRGLAKPDHLGQAGAARFVAHVRAVRQIVGAELATEQPIHEGGFVAGAPRGVKGRLVGRRKRVERIANQPKSSVPGDRIVVVGPTPAHHRMCDAAHFLQLEIRLLQQAGNTVLAKDFRRQSLRRSLGGDRLGAVLAEFGRLPLAVGIGPGATRAIEAVFLLQFEPRLEGARAAHLPHAVVDCLVDRAQAGGGFVTLLGVGAFFFDWRLCALHTMRMPRIGIGRLLGSRLVGSIVFIVFVEVHSKAGFWTANPLPRRAASYRRERSITNGPSSASHGAGARRRGEEVFNSGISRDPTNPERCYKAGLDRAGGTKQDQKTDFLPIPRRIADSCPLNCRSPTAAAKPPQASENRWKPESLLPASAKSN